MEGIILSSWDYVMGPQIEMLWLAENETNNRTFRVPVKILKDFNISKHCKNVTDSLNFSAKHCDIKTYSTMCGQLLLGEVDTLKPFDEWSSRFYVTEHKIIIAIIFRVDSWFYCGTAKEMKDVSLCLGIIFKREAIYFALDHRSVIDMQLRKAVDILLKSLEPEAFPVNHLSVLVEELVALINMLRESNLRCLQFHTHASLGNAVPSDIISKAIVSHLQTSCHSVVIGGSEFIINQVLHILSLVSSKRESSSSLSVTQLSSESYIRGLYIQGAIKDVEKGVQCLLDKAYEESSSLTVIDTDLFKVWQTIAVPENPEKEKNSPSIVTETGCLVPDLINNMLSFEKYQGDCTSLIQSFTRCLMMKATSLVKIVYHFRRLFADDMAGSPSVSSENLGQLIRTAAVDVALLGSFVFAGSSSSVFWRRRCPAFLLPLPLFLVVL